MPLSPKEFDSLRPPGAPDELPYRVMDLLGADEALSAHEVALLLLGRKPGWSAQHDPKVAELLPVVKPVLEALVGQGKVEVREKAGLIGPERYYRGKRE